MNIPESHAVQSSLSALQRFVRRPQSRIEICELCATPVAPEHCHVLELDLRRITCACDPCAILFSGNTRQRYKRIPRDVYRLDDFEMNNQEWESLLIPINLAYFVYNSDSKRVVSQYPSPAGPTESLLDLEYWNAIVDRNPVLKKFEPDVEALLVNRISAEPRYYRVPIDQCFRLVGIIRTQWHGLSGGSDVWQAIDRFFADLDRLSGGQIA